MCECMDFVRQFARNVGEGVETMFRDEIWEALAFPLKFMSEGADKRSSELHIAVKDRSPPMYRAFALT